MSKTENAITGHIMIAKDIGRAECATHADNYSVTTRLLLLYIYDAVVKSQVMSYWGFVFFPWCFAEAIGGDCFFKPLMSRGVIMSGIRCQGASA